MYSNVVTCAVDAYSHDVLCILQHWLNEAGPHSWLALTLLRVTEPRLELRDKFYDKLTANKLFMFSNMGKWLIAFFRKRGNDRIGLFACFYGVHAVDQVNLLH